MGRRKRKKKKIEIEKFEGYTLRIDYIAKKLKISRYTISYIIKRDGLPHVVVGDTIYIVQGLKRLGGRDGFLYSLPDLYDHIVNRVESIRRNDVIIVDYRRLFPHEIAIRLDNGYTKYIYAPAKELITLIWPDGEWIRKYVYMFRYAEPVPLEEIIERRIVHGPEAQGDTTHVSFLVSRELSDMLDKYAEKTGLSRSKVVQMALSMLLSKYYV
ncbi:MAG: ribbon-helix-helix domain-containing protein [Pyrobaculum sp.]